MTRGLTAKIHYGGRVGRQAIRHFLQDGCTQHAAALTYTTLFAVVPMLTVIFTALSVVPSTQHLSSDVQHFIFSNLLPSSGEKVQGYLQQFAHQASQLTLVGVAMLLVTAIMMLVNIERAFNAIWQVRVPPQSLYNFLRHWAVISLGPFLLGGGFFVSSYLTSLTMLRDTANLVGSVLPGLGLMPLLFTALGFTLIYVTVPNCRVPIRAGLQAGLIAALLFELAKRGFGFFVSHFGSYQLVYGTFAAFPVFLLWIYVSWLIVLFGVELSRSLILTTTDAEPPRHPLLSLLTLLALLRERHAQGQGVAETEAMRITHASPGWGWAQWKDWLQQEALIVRSIDGDFRLARDLDALDLTIFYQHLPWPLPAREALTSDAAWLPALRDWLQPLHDYLDRADSPSVACLLGARV